MGVDSVDEATKTIVNKGGKVQNEKMPVPGMGWFAICEDTEGNRVGVFEVDASAQMPG